MSDVNTDASLTLTLRCLSTTSVLINCVTRAPLLSCNNLPLAHNHRTQASSNVVIPGSVIYLKRPNELIVFGIAILLSGNNETAFGIY